MSCGKNTEATPVCSKDNCQCQGALVGANQCQGALVGANLCHGALHAYLELQTLGFCNSEVRWKPNFCQGVQNPNFRTLRAHSTLMSFEDCSGSAPCESNVK
ncbi:GSCOCG00012742001-RA-CDS [Cotesia congregata]|nr:GSCOCG00012742001-RA-CDS [Cotesia congregata]